MTVTDLVTLFLSISFQLCVAMMIERETNPIRHVLMSILLPYRVMMM
jgi:hypothetical protein